MIAARIYEGARGLTVDVAVVDQDGRAVDLSGLGAAVLRVLAPGAAGEVDWPVTVVPPNVLRHVVPEDTPLVAGAYQLQPELTGLGTYSGPWGSVVLPVARRQGR